MNCRTLAAAASALALTMPSHAQQESPAVPAVREAALGLPLRVPIHTQPDDPDGGPYGTWAAGRGFKVAFGARTVALHPDDARGAAWRWTTAAVRVGDAVLVGAESEAVTAFTPARFETRYAAVTEAYDLRDDGVEQSFVVHARPAMSGALVVVGRVDAPWPAVVTEAVHGAIAFRAGDDRGVDYGRAWAIDAVGRRVPIESAWDGAQITLTVPADFVDAAVYPLVVDPVIGPRAITNNSLPVRSVDVARDDVADKMWYALTFEASARDDDLRVFRCDDDFQNPVLVYADITTNWSTGSATIATVGGAQKAVAAFQRVFSSTQHVVRWHSHDVLDTSLGTTYGVMPGVSGGHDWLPDVGGSRAFATGDLALIAFQRDASGATFQNTATSAVMFSLVDVTGTGQGSASTPRTLNASALDQEFPSVTPLAEGGSSSGWPVAWQEYGTFRRGGYAWDAVVRRVEANGALSQAGHVARTSRTSAAHCLRPSIAGENGRYLLTYAESPLALVGGKTTFPEGHALVVERLDWVAGGAPQYVHAPVRRHEDTARRFQNGGCGHDSNTRSHWAATFVDTVANRVFVDKLGYRGRIVVALGASLANSVDPVVGGVTFDDDNGRFGFGSAAYNSTARNWVAYGSLLTYTAANGPTIYGIGCSTATPRWIGTHYRGDEFSAARVTGAPPNSTAFLLLAARPGTTPLDPYGMNRCFLNLDLATLLPVAIPAPIDARGIAQVPLPLPEEFSGLNLFCQWFLLDPGTTLLGVTATQGLHVTVVD